MSYTPGIESNIKHDVEALTGALMSGTVKAGKKVLSSFMDKAEVELLVLELIRFALSKKLLTLYMHALSSMKWLDLSEACIYARTSPNTLKQWYDEGKVNASPPDVSGSWRFDRESIDCFFNTRRDERRLELERLGKGAKV